VVQESCLHGMQGVPRGEPVDSGYLSAVVRHGERETRVNSPPVDQDGTRAALAVAAALFGACKLKMLAQ